MDRFRVLRDGAFPAWAWAALAWALLAWQGGLHPWQPALASLALAALVWRERRAVPAWGDFSAVERVLAVLGLCAFAGTAFSLVPQGTLNAASALGLAFVSLLILRRLDAFRGGWVADAWLYGGAVFSLAFLALLAWTGPPPWGDPVLAAARPLFPNQNALAWGLAVPALLLSLTRLARGGPKRAWLAALACAAVCILALVAAGSRGAFAALACGAAWILWRGRFWTAPSRARLRACVCVALLAAAALAAWAPFSRLKVRLERQAAPGRQDDNFYRRTDFWKGAFRLSLQRPLLGFGLGGFGAAAQTLDFPTPLTPRLPVSRYHLTLDHAHDEWLELACELGWPVCLALIACALLWLRRTVRRPPGPGDALGLEAALVCAGVVSLLDMNLRTPALGWGLLLTAAALSPREGKGKPGGEEGEREGGGRARRVASGLGLFLAALAVYCLCGAALARAFERSAPDPLDAGMLERVALWTQPLDASVAAAAEARGDLAWPWSAWAGRWDSAWWWHAAFRANRAGARPAAEEAAKRAVALRPFYAPGWYWLGLRLGADGQGKPAAACMDRALALEPNFCRVLAWDADQALAAGNRAKEQGLLRRILAVRALTQTPDAWDDYSRYLVSVDPDWLAARLGPSARSGL